MNIQGLVGVVEKIAPSIAAIIGGVNPLAGLLLSGLGELFGVKSNDPVALANAISADPDAKIKLQEFELKHQEVLAQYSQDTYHTEVEDRKDARQATLEEVRVTGKVDFIQQFCAVTIVLGFFAVCFSIAFTRLDVSDHDILYVLIGILGTNFNNVYGFYFGSSKSK